MAPRLLPLPPTMSMAQMMNVPKKWLKVSGTMLPWLAL